MEDVRLTPAERRALEEIEHELRKDRELDRALRTMRPARRRRRVFRRRRELPPASGEGATPLPRVAPGDERAEDGPNPRVLLLVMITALLAGVAATTSTTYVVVLAITVAVMACTAGFVWLCVSAFWRRA